MIALLVVCSKGDPFAVGRGICGTVQMYPTLTHLCHRQFRSQESMQGRHRH